MSLSKRLTYMIEAVNRTAEPFAEVENGIERLNQATMRASTLVFAEQRAQNLLIATFRQKYSAIYDTLGLMRSVGTIGSQIISIVNAQNISQIRLRDSLLDVEDAQTRLNTALELFGTDSVQAESALDDLEKATNRLEDAQDSAKAATVGIGLQAVGVFGAAGTFTLSMITAISKAGGLETVLGTIAGYASGLIIPVTLTVIGLLALKEALKLVKKARENIAAADPLREQTHERWEEEGIPPVAWPTIEPPVEWGGTAPGVFSEDTLGDFPYPEEYLEDLKLSRQELQDKMIARQKGDTTTNIEVNVETNADPDQIADAVEKAIYRRDRIMR